ncbi:MAG: hypothetical protein GEU83_05765 [Pseudonocardiaceae bacterium]|nr:hypothetical protein [Pseudonocardiaceae bacterium]
MTTELAEPADSVPGSGVPAEPSETVLAAERLLTARLGAQVELADPEDLGGSDSSVVLRVRVARNPFSLSRTLVVKRRTAQAPQAVAGAFAREAASCQLFTALHTDERPGPALIASDPEQQLLVLEDLGRAGTVESVLLSGDRAQAQRALLDWAHALGKLHAATAGREADFAALLRRQGSDGLSDPLQQQGGAALGGLPTLLVDELGLSTPPDLGDDIRRAAQLLDGQRFRAFSPADLGADNAVVVGRTVRFIDFEGGAFRTAALDAAQLRTPLPSSGSDHALPAGVVDDMQSTWLDEAATLWPELADRRLADGLLLDGQLVWTWLGTWWLLHRPDAGGHGALVDRWQRLAIDAAALDRSVLAGYASEVCSALRDRFDVANDGVALYPVFD